MIFEVENIKINKRILIEKTRVRVAQKSITVIKGDNGTGKSVLLRRLFSICNENKWKAVFVEQGNDFFWPESSILENISLSNSDAGIEKARELLADINMAYLENHSVSELSGGEKRILCILRGVYQADDQGIVFIDEPTNDLDYHLVNKLKELFLRLKKDLSIVVVSHDDRIIALADAVYTISDRHLQQDPVPDDENNNDREMSLAKETKINYICMSKSLKLRWISLLAAFVLALISVYGTYILAERKQKTFSVCSEREIDIMIPTTNFGSSYITSEAVPVKMVSLLQNGISVSEKIKSYNEIMNLNLPINYGLNEFCAEENKHQLFQLEFYSPIDDVYYYPFDYYHSIAGISPDYYIDTSDYFSSDYFDISEKSVKLDVDIYKECVETLVKEYENKDLQCTYLALDLNEEESLEDYINNSDIRELYDGNFYVRSMEISDFLRQMETIITQRKAAFLSVSLGTCIFALGILLTILALLASRKVLIVARDVNAGKKEIIKVVQGQFFKIKYVTIIFLAAGAGNIAIIANREEADYIGNYLSMLICVGVIVFLQKVQKRLTALYIKHLWNWRTR